MIEWPLSGETSFHILMGMVAVGAIYGVSLWAWNNAQPVLTRTAWVISKRINDGTAEAADSYYVTFEAEDRTKQEFGLSRQAYGLLTEGERGTLTSQGTRYQGFARSPV